MECSGTPASPVLNIYYYIVFCWNSDMELRLGLRAGLRARSLGGRGGELGLTELLASAARRGRGRTRRHTLKAGQTLVAAVINRYIYIYVGMFY